MSFFSKVRRQKILCVRGRSLNLGTVGEIFGFSLYSGPNDASLDSDEMPAGI